jgi:hypothetical protein
MLSLPLMFVLGIIFCSNRPIEGIYCGPQSQYHPTENCEPLAKIARLLDGPTPRDRHSDVSSLSTEKIEEKE